jgi:hypothetical protein
MEGTDLSLTFDSRGYVGEADDNTDANEVGNRASWSARIFRFARGPTAALIAGRSVRS